MKTTFVGLEEVGLFGNNHQFMVEKNSNGIAQYFMSWLEKNFPEVGTLFRQDTRRVHPASRAATLV